MGADTNNSWDRQRYDETIAGLRSYLTRQCTLSLATREYLDGRPTPVFEGPFHDISLLQVRTYQALLRAVEISASTLEHLTKNVSESIRDCFPISRSIVESAINLAYIAASGADTAEQAREHSVRRSVRDLDRELSIGCLTFRHRSQSLDQNESTAALTRALEILAEEKGRKPRNWTPHSVQERITVILNCLGEKIAAPLAHAYFNIYADASEVVHGSVYGCLLSFGATKAEPEVSLHDYAFVVLFSSATALNRGIAAIGAAHGIEKIVERADTFDLLLATIPAFADALAAERTANPSRTTISK